MRTFSAFADLETGLFDRQGGPSPASQSPLERRTPEYHPDCSGGWFHPLFILQLEPLGSRTPHLPQDQVWQQPQGWCPEMLSGRGGQQEAHHMDTDRSQWCARLSGTTHDAGHVLWGHVYDTSLH